MDKCIFHVKSLAPLVPKQSWSMDTRKQVREYNIKSGMPASEEAKEIAKCVLRRSKENKDGCAVIIHGYVSCGFGGVIRE